MDMRTFLLGTLLASTLTTPVLAGDFPEPGNLTGTWIGEMKCKMFDGLFTYDVPLVGELYVVQDGTRLAAATDLCLPGCGSVGTEGIEVPPATMCGVVFPKKATEPAVGVGSLGPLGADGETSLGMIEEFQIAALKSKTFAETDDGATGKLTGKGTLLPSFVAGSCRWKFVRTSTLVPLLSTAFCMGEI